MGEILGVQSAIPYKQVRAFETSPALVAIIVAILLLLDYRFHQHLLFQPFALTYGWLRMVRWLFGFNPHGCRVAEFLRRH